MGDISEEIKDKANDIENKSYELKGRAKEKKEAMEQED